MEMAVAIKPIIKNTKKLKIPKANKREKSSLNNNLMLRS